MTGAAGPRTKSRSTGTRRWPTRSSPSPRTTRPHHRQTQVARSHGDASLVTERLHRVDLRGFPGGEGTGHNTGGGQCADGEQRNRNRYFGVAADLHLHLLVGISSQSAYNRRIYHTTLQLA